MARRRDGEGRLRKGMRGDREGKEAAERTGGGSVEWEGSPQRRAGVYAKRKFLRKGAEATGKGRGEREERLPEGKAHKVGHETKERGERVY